MGGLSLSVVSARTVGSLISVGMSLVSWSFGFSMFLELIQDSFKINEKNKINLVLTSNDQGARQHVLKY